MDNYKHVTMPHNYNIDVNCTNDTYQLSMLTRNTSKLTAWHIGPTAKTAAHFYTAKL